jgi:hypothetical protein
MPARNRWTVRRNSKSSSNLKTKYQNHVRLWTRASHSYSRTTSGRTDGVRAVVTDRPAETEACAWRRGRPAGGLLRRRPGPAGAAGLWARATSRCSFHSFQKSCLTQTLMHIINQHELCTNISCTSMSICDLPCHSHDRIGGYRQLLIILLR